MSDYVCYNGYSDRSYDDLGGAPERARFGRPTGREELKSPSRSASKQRAQDVGIRPRGPSPRLQPADSPRGRGGAGSPRALRKAQPLPNVDRLRREALCVEVRAMSAFDPCC